MFIYAVISITLALVFYTVGVWSEKIQGELKNIVGVVFDRPFPSDNTII